jgi:hypothetical protein
MLVQLEQRDGNTGKPGYEVSQEEYETDETAKLPDVAGLRPTGDLVEFLGIGADG